MRIISKKTAKQMYGSRLSWMCGRRTEAMQKLKISWTHWRPYFTKINVVRSAIAKRLCNPGLGPLFEPQNR